MKDTYRTIKTTNEGLFKNKGSKFIALSYPIASEEEVKKIIQKLKKEHHNARHHCYAFRIGYNGEKYRSSDDGEPSGTAGRPILGQLLSFEITNILVVVVRYFGGTLLGVSGLIHAYKNATIDVLNNSDIIEKIIKYEINLEFDYSLQNIVMKTLREEAADIVTAEYTTNCKIKIEIRKNNVDVLRNKLSNIHGVRCE